MTPTSIRRLFDYSYWAFERVWDCIMDLSDAQFTKDIDYSVGSIRNHVVHMMSLDLRWIRRVQGTTVPPLMPFEIFNTRADAKAKWDDIKDEVLTYVYSLDQAGLDEPVRYEIRTSLLGLQRGRWELLLHVANHGTDHRAQLLAMLHTHFGVKTVEQDLIFYLMDEA
jgi:uncharacterized damage-inducible protein DinB